ncbi:hypothetical protein B0H14DRAFT_2805069 [Mycena olivaceomarginata]|nr:hypothetical protein B0H14DRAFT_2805069 [Mycena olivaceomarginata]
MRWLAPCYGGLGAGLVLCFLASGDYTRFTLMATALFLFCVSLFFALQVISSIAFPIGPVA